MPCLLGGFSVKKIVAVAFAVGHIACVMPAQAAIYVANYTGTDGPAATASFTFTTADAMNSRGGYDILGVTGNVNGDAITSLVANPNAPNRSISSGNRWYYDNVYYDAARLFDSDGVLFTTASGAEFTCGGTPPHPIVCIQGWRTQPARASG
jgi:hypothetical protein